MTSTAEIAKPERKAAGKAPPRVLTVESAFRLTPNMIRVVFAGPELDGFPTGRDGGNCKLMLPNVDESRRDFAERLLNGPRPVRRTYTVRRFDAETQRLTIYLVAHGDEGPASAWASRARPDGSRSRSQQEGASQVRPKPDTG